MKASTIHLGFEVGTGVAVEIPLAHTFVTGQTQLSGKTTTLRAIVERSGQRALAFVTKRGEEFAGRRVLPYLPREGAQPIHWRLVETLLASALGQRNMKYERFQIVNAAKGAFSLADVRRNVDRLGAKGGRAAEIYELLGEYLDLVLPEMRALAAADTLDLQPGLNVMNLGGVGPQLQALVIRAALEQINHHETGVLAVFPEAWEFAPRGRSAPAKDEAIAMIRKGAVLKNFLLCDSQDISGVDTVIRQGASVWILGVQRELNELKRTLQTIPAGITRPKAEHVAQLELGQFYACWGRHAIKVYVQPAGMDAAQAHAVAMGTVTVDQVQRQQSSIAREANAVARRCGVAKETTVTIEEAARLTRENDELKTDNADLQRRVEALEKGSHDTARTQTDRAAADRAQHPDARRAAAPRAAATAPGGRPFTFEESRDHETVYQAFKARLIAEAATDPVLLRVLSERPAIDVEVTRKTATMDGDSLSGRIVMLIANGWYDAEPKGTTTTLKELRRTGFQGADNVRREMDRLLEKGFLSKEDGGYQAVSGMKINIIEK